MSPTYRVAERAPLPPIQTGDNRFIERKTPPPGRDFRARGPCASGRSSNGLPHPADAATFGYPPATAITDRNNPLRNSTQIGSDLTFNTFATVKKGFLMFCLVILFTALPSYRVHKDSISLSLYTESMTAKYPLSSTWLTGKLQHLQAIGPFVSWNAIWSKYLSARRLVDPITGTITVSF